MLIEFFFMQQIVKKEKTYQLSSYNGHSWTNVPWEGPCIGHLGPWGPLLEPQTTIYTPKMSQFSLAALLYGKDQKYSLKTVKCTFSSLNPPHSWHGAMYWPSGTLGTPIGAPKQQYLPQNKSVFLSYFPGG